LPELPVNTSLFLEIDAQPYLRAPAVRGQILRVTVNGRRLGSFVLTGRSIVRCRIAPHIVLAGEATVLQLDLPTFVRPHILGQGDSRALAIGVFSVSVYSAATAPKETETAPLAQPHAPSAFASERKASPERYDFNAAGTGSAALKEGWHTTEDGVVWTGARTSVLAVASLSGPHPRLLTVRLAPLRIRPIVLTQRLTLSVNGFVVGQFVLASDTSLVVAIPPEALSEGQEAEVVFSTPDAVSLAHFMAPSSAAELAFVLDMVSVEPAEESPEWLERLRDDELGALSHLKKSAEFLDHTLSELPAAIEARSGLKLADMISQFESLGDNCTFGIAQRKAGVEVLGLLRFGTTALNSVLRGFEDEFAALKNSSELSVEFNDGVPREFLVKASRYNITWHTYKYENETTQETIFKENAVKIGYLRRKFFEGLRAGRKIYVLGRSSEERRVLLIPTASGRFVRFLPTEPLRLAEVLPVWRKLQEYGQNALLYVVRAKGEHSPGSVEWLAPGLMRAHIKRLTVSDDVAISDHDEWLRIVGNAWRLHSQSRAQPSAASALTEVDVAS
jgi:hypothetical protein